MDVFVEPGPRMKCSVCPVEEAVIDRCVHQPLAEDTPYRWDGGMNGHLEVGKEGPEDEETDQRRAHQMVEQDVQDDTTDQSGGGICSLLYFVLRGQSSREVVYEQGRTVERKRDGAVAERHPKDEEQAVSIRPALIDI